MLRKILIKLIGCIVRWFKLPFYRKDNLGETIPHETNRIEVFRSEYRVSENKIMFSPLCPENIIVNIKRELRIG